MCKGLRSKKEPEKGERIVHGSGAGVSFADEEDASVVVGRARKKEREK